MSEEPFQAVDGGECLVIYGLLDPRLNFCPENLYGAIKIVLPNIAGDAASDLLRYAKERGVAIPAQT